MTARTLEGYPYPEIHEYLTDTVDIWETKYQDEEADSPNAQYRKKMDFTYKKKDW